jgi:hypothetical protein
LSFLSSAPPKKKKNHNSSAKRGAWLYLRETHGRASDYTSEIDHSVCFSGLRERGLHSPPIWSAALGPLPGGERGRARARSRARAGPSLFPPPPKKQAPESPRLTAGRVLRASLGSSCSPSVEGRRLHARRHSFFFLFVFVARAVACRPPPPLNNPPPPPNPPTPPKTKKHRAPSPKSAPPLGPTASSWARSSGGSRCAS